MANTGWGTQLGQAHQNNHLYWRTGLAVMLILALCLYPQRMGDEAPISLIDEEEELLQTSAPHFNFIPAASLDQEVTPLFAQPLPTREQLLQVSEISAPEVLKVTDQFYQRALQDLAVSVPVDGLLNNEQLRRLHRFAISYNLMSRLRFNRGIQKFSSQKRIEQLIHAIPQTDWYDAYILRITSNTGYSYSEQRALRILIGLHTMAEMFRLPYPSFFCLIFRESKFDFKAFSHTGARGLGQLTSIAIEQTGELREDPLIEEYVQNILAYLNFIYHDPVLNEVMKQMGFEVQWPELGTLPKKIRSPEINTSVLREVSREVAQMPVDYHKDFELIARLGRQVSRGYMIPEEYAPVQQAYVQVVGRRFEQHVGNALNIETNLLISALLLRYYIDYPWTLNGEPLTLSPKLRVALAIAAYNHGPLGITRYLKQFQSDFPQKDLSQLTLYEFRETYTRRRVSRALQDNANKVKEVITHVQQIMNCSESIPLFPEE